MQAIDTYLSQCCLLTTGTASSLFVLDLYLHSTCSDYTIGLKILPVDKGTPK